jgi:hypothetical protein
MVGEYPSGRGGCTFSRIRNHGADEQYRLINGIVVR